MSVADMQQGVDPHFPPTLVLSRHSLQSITLSFFIGRQRTVFDAGFALKTHGSLVKGLMPFFAFVAGLFFSSMLSMPASLKEPDFFTCSTATPISESTTPFTSFVFSPVVSATDWNTPVCVIAPPAFIAFIAFIAGMVAIEVVIGQVWEKCAEAVLKKA